MSPFLPCHPQVDRVLNQGTCLTVRQRGRILRQAVPYIAKVMESKSKKQFQHGTDFSLQHRHQQATPGTQAALPTATGLEAGGW